MTTRPDTSPPAWDDQAQLLTDLALADLRAGVDVRPTLTAFRGPDPLFLATLRPFDRGGHQGPIIEVGALAMSLHADRVLLSLSGRAWSMDDPIPPVVDGVGDLRQRVVVLHEADAAGPDPFVTSTVLPVLEGPDQVRFGPPLAAPDAEGWVPAALLVLVQVPPEQVDLVALGAQVLRCEALGHRVAWAPDVAPVARASAMQVVREDLAGEMRRPWDQVTAPAAMPGW